MKKLFFLSMILISLFISSQEITKDTYTITLQIAEFPNGGATGFRQIIVDNFRENKVKGKGNESCELRFIIERDGSISTVEANGSNESFNKEAIRAISKVKTKWIPATIDNQPVRYRFRIPLNLDFN